MVKELEWTGEGAHLPKIGDVKAGDKIMVDEDVGNSLIAQGKAQWVVVAKKKKDEVPPIITGGEQ